MRDKKKVEYDEVKEGRLQQEDLAFSSVDDRYAIEVRNLYKSFRLYHEKKSTLYEHFAGLFSKSKGYEKLDVLRGISFDVKKGEMLGIIAKNGQGKTTLLQLLSGILTPD